MVRELDDVTAVPRGQRPVSSLAAAQPLASLSGGSSVFADVSIVQLDDDVDVDNNLLPIDHCSDRVPHATVRYLFLALLVLVFFFFSSSSSSSFSFFLLLFFWHAPLGVRSAIFRHQPPRRTVLGPVDCPGGLFHLSDAGAVRIILASASSAMRAICQNVERRRDWVIAVRL